MSWILTNCKADCDGQRVYVVETDLSSLEGLIINGIVLSDVTINPTFCWTVSQGDDTVSSILLLSYNAFFSDCANCIPVPCEPCDFSLRIDKDCRAGYNADYSDDYSEDYFI